MTDPVNRINIAGCAGGIGVSTLTVGLAAVAHGCAIARAGSHDLRPLATIENQSDTIADIAFFGGDPWHFFDAGRDATPFGTTILVVPRRYGGLRNLVAGLVAEESALVGFVDWATEHDTLTLDDVRAVTGDLPHLGTITERTAVARAIDAGVLLDRWYRDWEKEIRTVWNNLQMEVER